jgi:hypothetical protein
MASPSSLVARLPASKKSKFFLPTASTMAACILSGKAQSGLRVNSEVGVSKQLTTPWVVPTAILARASRLR